MSNERTQRDFGPETTAVGIATRNNRRDCARGGIIEDGGDEVASAAAIARGQIDACCPWSGQGCIDVADPCMRNRIQDHDALGDNAHIGDIYRAYGAGREVVVRNQQRCICRALNDTRLTVRAGEFELAARTTVAGRGIAVVTLLVCLDNPVSTNARDGGIDAQSEGPAIKRAGGSRRIVREAQDPGAIRGLIAKAGKIGNRLFRAECTNKWSDARRDERRASITKCRGEEVGAGWSVRHEFALGAKGRGEENVEIGGRCVRDVNRRNDLPDDARLGDVDGADDPRVVIGNGRGRRIGDNDGYFARSAGNIELTGARAAIAARHVLVVALFEAAEQSVPANGRTSAWCTGASPARFNDARRIAAVVCRVIAVVASFGAIDDAITTGNARACCARSIGHVRCAHRAVHQRWIRTRAGHLITRAHRVALIRRHASDGVCPGTRTSNARVGLRASIAIRACRTVCRRRIRTHTRHGIAATRHVALIRCHTGDRVCPCAGARLTGIRLRAEVAVIANGTVGSIRI